MRAPAMGRRLYAALMFILVSVLGGVLVAGIAVPTVGFAAEMAKTGALAVRDIPKEVETPPPSEGSVVLMADGSELTTFYDENREYVPLDRIAPIMRQAQISVEDQRFYEHGALDLRGTLRALVRTSSGNMQGGSTITQQYVKLALIDQAVASNDKQALAAANDRTISRKILELRYAIALEQKLSKDEILERYLNLAYYGAGAYGVEAASRRYFGIPASELNLSKAAMLAGLVRNPATTDPINYEKLAIERRNNVLDIMLGQGVITKDQYDQARAEGFDRSKVTTPRHGCGVSPFPQLCATVESQLLGLESLGPDVEARRHLLNRGGLTIQTEIDPRTQRAAQKAVSDYVHPTDPAIGLMIMVEPGTGLIKGLAQSRPELGDGPGQTYLNYATAAGTKGFNGGSTYKMFTLAAALEKGLPFSTAFTSERTKPWGGERFAKCDGWYVAPKDYTVTNAGAGGTFDMLSGTKNSVNNYFVALEQQVGLCDVTRMAEKLGLKLVDWNWDQAQTATFTLGFFESRPLSVVNAYATIAARGVRCDPILLKSAAAKDGRTFEVPSANCEQVIEPDVADKVAEALKGPFDGGTAASASVPGYTLAGKTGTDGQNTKAVWTVGFTPKLAGGAMIGLDTSHPRFKGRDYESLKLQGTPVRGGSAVLAGSSGREAGAGIFKPAMQAALPIVEKDTTATVAPNKAGNAPVPTCEGLQLKECQKAIEDAGFAVKVEPTNDRAPKGTILGTDPTGDQPKGSTITLHVSSGKA